MSDYTAVVIGAGPAGHTCAVRLAQLGARVAVVERDFVGGICTNWGCTPSKSMIESAKIARNVREAGRYGVNVSSFWVDFEKVAARRDEVILRSRGIVSRLLEHHGVQVFQGEAQIVSPGRLRIRQGKLGLDGLEMSYTGTETMIEAEHIVVATGSRPLMPSWAPPDHPYIVSSNRLITIGELPESLTVVGGGVIGLEFATIFANMGTRVTVVELQDRLLGTLDPEISHALTEELNLIGVRTRTGHRVISVEEGYVRAAHGATGDIVDIPGRAVLVAIGREPIVDAPSFDHLGVEHSTKGIGVDAQLRTSVANIWAIGDATGKSILAHVGMQQALVCADNIMTEPGRPRRSMEYGVIPSVVYSIPEVVAVGEVPDGSDDAVTAFKVPFSANLRARIESYEEGFVKIWVRDGKVVAAQAIGYYVSELMQELTDMIALGTPVHAVADIIHAHPTYSEITRSVLELSLGRATDFLMPERSARGETS
ncbi:MAG TPA: NAD(P)/FAD-dependent oxidoreductase [Nocardioidaceae bacterium]